MWTLSKSPERKQVINKVSVSDCFAQFCRCVHLLEVFIKVLIQSILATTISFICMAITKYYSIAKAILEFNY